MSVTVDLPPEALRKLEAEASRRGVSIDVVIAELAERLPTESGHKEQKLAFVGIGASGDTRPLDIHQLRAEAAEKKLTEGI
jgi:hypothetical protein